MEKYIYLKGVLIYTGNIYNTVTYLQLQDKIDYFIKNFYDKIDYLKCRRE